MTSAAPSVPELARTLGVDDDLEVLVAWARERADALVGEGLDQDLSGLLASSLARGPSPAHGPSPAPGGATPPPRPGSSSHAPPVSADRPGDDDEDGEDGEELEELDVAELEELDMTELEVLEDDADTGSVDEGGREAADTSSVEDEGGPLDDFVGAPSSAEDAGPNYAPTDTQPLEPVDAEIVDDDEGDGGDGNAENAENDGDEENDERAISGETEGPGTPGVTAAPVRTGDTATQMSRDDLLAEGGEFDDDDARRARSPEAPEQVQDEASGDLFDEDELDIDIDV